jgi:hypothetical protein
LPLQRLAAVAVVQQEVLALILKEQVALAVQVAVVWERVVTEVSAKQKAVLR